VKDVFSVAFPLAFAKAIEDEEFKILTIFASTKGAATWATASFLWDILEMISGVIGEACEVRVAYQLGKGRPEMAKIVGYKAMLVAFITAMLGVNYIAEPEEYPAIVPNERYDHPDTLLDLFPGCVDRCWWTGMI